MKKVSFPLLIIAAIGILLGTSATSVGDLRVVTDNDSIVQDSSKTFTNQSPCLSIEKTAKKDKDEDVTYVYVTNTGKKYHTKDCRFVKKSKQKIKLEEAKARGYKPCSHCHPPEK